MNLIDVLLLIIILLSVWNGVVKGFIIGSIELITWLGSLILCFYIYPYLSTFLVKYVFSSSLWVLPLSFIITIVLIRLFFSLIVDRIFLKIPTLYHTKPLNKALGFLPGLVNGLVYSLVATGFLILFPFGANIKAATQESWLAGKFTYQLEKLQLFLTPVIEDVGKKSLKRILIEPGSEEFIRLGFKVKTNKVRPDLEAEMLTMINKEREKRGLHLLKSDPELAEVARSHSKDMFLRGYFSHYTPEKKDPFDRIRAGNITFIAAGENLALAPTLKLAHQNLMNSPGHKANILHKSFGRVGIGILDGGVYGLMVTQNFRN